MSLINVIPTEYQPVAKLVGGLVLVATLTGGGALAAGKYYEPRVALAEAQAQGASDRAHQFEVAYTALAAATQHQNAAINDLQAQGVAREEVAKKAIAAAQGAAQGLYTQAEKVSASRPPAASDECTAARQAFDDELAQERGLK